MSIDIREYLKAGYVAQCHCRADIGLEYVSRQLDMNARLSADNCTIEVEIAPELWTASGYYWEEYTLFKKVD